MKCSRCQADNAAGQRFCGECGARLASVCAACGATNPHGQKFCGGCGGALTHAAATLTDDAGARVVATLRGMEVHGSLGVVLWAVAQRHISRHEAAPILERLAGSSLWISPAILAEARRALDALS